MLLIGVIAGGSYLLWQQLELDHAAHVSETVALPEVSDRPLDVEKNPIDFATLQAANQDIYAWVYLPGTDINYPVLRHPSDDSFYLDHNDGGDYAIEGAIYTESVNNADFTDPVTVLYGHCLLNGSMFSSLHDFKDAAFFDKHDTLLIYLPDRILTYRIISAYEYDDRHIIKTNDFSDRLAVQTYFDFVSNPDSETRNVREDTRLTADDKIVQLSTCTSPTEDTAFRYIVTGVLINEQQTD